VLDKFHRFLQQTTLDFNVFWPNRNLFIEQNFFKTGKNAIFGGSIRVSHQGRDVDMQAERQTFILFVKQRQSLLHFCEVTCLDTQEHELAWSVAS
jgi:hypothetical protein